MEPQDWGVLTTKGKTWYAHIIKTLQTKISILMTNRTEKIKKSVLFETKKPLKFKQTKEGIVVDLSGITLDETEQLSNYN